MKKIPKEANDIICMSLIKGVSRASIISHGTLWVQVWTIAVASATKTLILVLCRNYNNVRQRPVQSSPVVSLHVCMTLFS